MPLETAAGLCCTGGGAGLVAGTEGSGARANASAAAAGVGKRGSGAGARTKMRFWSMGSTAVAAAKDAVVTEWWSDV